MVRQSKLRKDTSVMLLVLIQVDEQVKLQRFTIIFMASAHLIDFCSLIFSSLIFSAQMDLDPLIGLHKPSQPGLTPYISNG